jgi:L-rhamnose-H+ transport protein
MDTITIAFLLVIFASIFQGSFGLGMKYIKPLAWESWWLVHATVAMILFPMIWAFIAVPDLLQAIVSAPSTAIVKAMLFGFLWGIGGIMFGISVGYIGVSLTYGIVMGLASAVGSLIPLFQIEGATGSKAFPIILAGVGIMLVGVAITAAAGIKRDKLQSGRDSENAGLKKGKAFQVGLVIAIICGALSALLNVGFANATPVAESAREFGAISRNASLASWVVVLWGAYLMNAGYAIFLLFKNKSWGSFSVAGASKAYKWSIIAGLCWFAALGVYGQGAALLGEIGPVIGWPIMLGLSLIIGNFWAYRAKEWDNAQKPFRMMLAGLAVLIVACIVLGYSNSAF